MAVPVPRGLGSRVRGGQPGGGSRRGGHGGLRHVRCRPHGQLGRRTLNLGRKTRQWSTAQWRAIALGDGGRRRFVGCQFAHCDIHPIRPWEAAASLRFSSAAIPAQDRVPSLPCLSSSPNP